MVSNSTADETGRRSVGGGVRATRQRGAVVALLEKLDGFRSAQELHEELRRGGANIGLTTVYRTLQALESADLLDMVRTDTGESLYRRCAAPHHHHHLVCRNCGAAVEVSGREVEAWAAEVAAKHGYSEVNHTIELFGTCAGCRNLPADAPLTDQP